MTRFNPLYSPMLGVVLPVLKLRGLSDQDVRDCWDQWGAKVYDPTQPRVVRLGADSTSHAIHPDDLFMTRLPQFRPKAKRSKR